MGVVPIYAFLRHSSTVPDFHCENPATCHLNFEAKIRHRLPYVTQTVTITPAEVSRYIYIYIYTCIMHNASTHSKKVNVYILRAWPKV